MVGQGGGTGSSAGRIITAKEMLSAIPQQLRVQPGNDEEHKEERKFEAI